MFKKVICTTHCNRPEYTRKFIQKLSQCEDISNFKLIVCVEPLSDEVISLLQNIDFCEKEIVINDFVYGAARNVRKSLELAFNQSDFIIHVESDCLLSKDALVETWRVAQEYKNSNNASILLFNRSLHVHGISSYVDEDFTKVTEVGTFISAAYGAWKNRFYPALDVMCDLSCQSCKEQPNLNYGMFVASDFTNIQFSEEMYRKIIRGLTHPSQDIILNRYFQYKKMKHLIFSVGRVINIGITGNHLQDNDKTRQWWKENIQCNIWADNIREINGLYS